MYPDQDPYQGRQQFRDPLFGQSQHEGTVEEQMHRSVTRRMNHSRTPLRDVFERPGGKLAIGFGAVGIVVAIAALTLLILYKGSATAQMSQMQQQLAGISQQLQATRDQQAAYARSYTGLYDGLSGKITALDNAMGAYPLICGGVGTDYFPCSSTRP